MTPGIVATANGAFEFTVTGVLSGTLRVEFSEDLKKWNALDLQQWEFYWLPVQVLRELGWASISLRTLRHRFGGLSAQQLSAVGRAAVAEFESKVAGESRKP